MDSTDTIEVKDVGAAKLWTQQVYAEIEETKGVLLNCTATVKAVNDLASGSIVDNLVHLANEFTERVETVTNLMNEVTGAIAKWADGFRNMFRH